MADSKITALTALTSATSDDLLAIVDDPAGTPITKKISVGNLMAFGSPPSGSAGGDLAGSYPNPTVAKSSTSFGLTGVISPAQLTANTNDWSPTGLSTCNVIDVSTDTTRSLTGIDATTAYDGRVLVLRNVGAQILSLIHNATSTAANRLDCSQGRSVNLAATASAVLTYSATLSRWMVLTEKLIQSSVANAVGTAAAGTSAQISAGDHVHATGAGTPSTQAFGDAAAVGTGPAAAMTDHKHAMPANPGTPLEFFGDGNDGPLDFTTSGATTAGATRSGTTYTMTRDIYATTLTVESTVIIITAGFRIFCTGTLTNLGTIHNDGGAASGITAGARGLGGLLGGGGIGAVGQATGTSTVIGTAGETMSAQQHALGGIGGAGGNSNGGAAGSKVTQTNAPGFRDPASILAQLPSWTRPAANLATAAAATDISTAFGGTGGGGGGRTTGTTTKTAGAGGGGAGIVVIAARTITNTGSIIRANGGTGANSTESGGTATAGGGGGGGGGAVFLIYNSLAAGTETAAGGTKGTTASGAAAAADGSAGIVVKIALTA